MDRIRRIGHEDCSPFVRYRTYECLSTVGLPNLRDEDLQFGPAFLGAQWVACCPNPGWVGSNLLKHPELILFGRPNCVRAKARSDSFQEFNRGHYEIVYFAALQLKTLEDLP